MNNKLRHDPPSSSVAKREKKDKVIPLRVNRQEYETIRAKATLAGLSVSQYLRKLGMNHPVKARFDEEEKRNLRGVGRNLNQLTAFAHKGYFYEKLLLEVLEMLKNILKG
jgi:hypothetical protein